ncbi:hypothetical protein, partial [Leptospira stimsonii]|uniref:hypothetical protein n=1 Tax=Leptospira stimsonii TaxID=2202203 RepID=UPI0019D44A1D
LTIKFGRMTWTQFVIIEKLNTEFIKLGEINLFINFHRLFSIENLAIIFIPHEDDSNNDR